ncbi:MAG: SirB2 family protein [Gammaproteobacteria bacterium]|nr:SirB2 family protein [Gammaproteobacteria bacterium]
MSFYLLFKTIHIATVTLSISFFITRTYWLLNNPQMLKHKLIKRLPHVIDSLLLFSAFAMLYIAELVPGSNNPWITAKLIGLILYIFTGLYLFRIAKRKIQIYSTLCIAILIYIYIIQTALTKNIIPALY